MYNLFVTCQEGAWESDSFVEYEGTRYLYEHTKNEYRDSYRVLDDRSVEVLKSVPCLLMYETPSGGDAQIGWIKKIKKRGDKVRIEFEIDRRFPRISSDKLSEMTWDLDINDWELYRTHWALKDAVLLEVLGDAGLIAYPKRVVGSEFGLDYEVAPKIFKIPELAVEEDLISVMMPFGPAFNSVYEGIIRSCINSGVRCQRVDDIWEESEIVQDIFSLIYRSRFVICDFTDSNPNVFYEAGIAHTLGKIVIPIAQHESDIPFDLRHHRYIKYHSNVEGIGILVEQLERRIETLLNRGIIKRSPVLLDVAQSVSLGDFL
jgi:hypothetical protein